MENLSLEWYNRRPARILTHVAAWAIVLTLPYLLNGITMKGMSPIMEWSMRGAGSS